MTMKITKYPQSCLLIEKDDHALLIDPGSLVAANYNPTDFLMAEAILITHEHHDHADTELVSALSRQGGIPVIANASTKRLLGDTVTRVVQDGEYFSIAGFDIRAHELPHMTLADGNPGPQNTGYSIDGVFFHPGDGLDAQGLHSEYLAVPIAGPDASPRHVVSFVQQVGATKIVPIHYDLFPGDPIFMKKLIEQYLPSVTCIPLNNGESAEF